MPITSTEFNFHQLTTVNSELAYLKFILKLSQSRHKHKPFKQLKLLFRSIYWLQPSKTWFETIANSTILSKLLLKQPGLIEKIHKPYLLLDYSIHRRLAAISEHYLLLNQCFNQASLQKIMFDSGICLATIATEQSQFQLVLAAVGDDCKEGELEIRLIDANHSALSILRFNFFKATAGLGLYIAAIQGPKGLDSKALVKTACLQLSGLSPNRLVIEACLAMAKQLNVQQIVMVNDHQQVFKHKQNLHFNYNQFATDLGARLTQNDDWELPLFIERKAKAYTPRKRRAKYQRQHAFLNNCYENCSKKLFSQLKTMNFLN